MGDQKTVFLSLGSNLGKRKKNILQALDLLSQHEVSIDTVSPFFETEPVGDSAHPLFLNIVCRASTQLPPYRLLEACQEVEWNLGRNRKGDHSPRCIDIDILFYSDLVLSSSLLKIPHPELGRRNFVLLPLREMDQDFVNPITGEKIDEMIERCEDESWVRILE